MDSSALSKSRTVIVRRLKVPEPQPIIEAQGASDTVTVKFPGALEFNVPPTSIGGKRFIVARKAADAMNVTAEMVSPSATSMLVHRLAIKTMLITQNVDAGKGPRRDPITGS